MLKRLFVALLFAGCALPAFATDYSDMWYVPAESGWGVNFTQNADILFMTFFVYDQGGKPTWYVAITSADANGNFSGTLYSTVGTYFGSPWNPSAWAPTAAGTASFTPVNAAQGSLTYTLNNGPTVTKSIVRQTLVTVDLTGNYTGGQAGGYSGCSDPSNDFLYKDTFDLQVQQTGSSVSFGFSYNGLGESCTLSGTLVQTGQLYSITSGTYQCQDGLSTSVNLFEIKKTSLGIEGRFSAPVGGNCQEDASFSAVDLQ
ncbi:MAG TPA: hypothetical protein VMN79_10405 [Casimicrobiaceae bacterium]|nr:hypothetical protein [Casimicrobiaceae bacterium]